jgi:hypothetical protein
MYKSIDRFSSQFSLWVKSPNIINIFNKKSGGKNE